MRVGQLPKYPLSVAKQAWGDLKWSPLHDTETAIIKKNTNLIPNKYQTDFPSRRNPLLFLTSLCMCRLADRQTSGPYAGFSEGGFEMERKVGA